MRSGGAYYGPQGNRCTRGDRANAEYFEQLRRSKKVGKAISEEVFEAIKTVAIRAQPLTGKQIAELISRDFHSGVAPCLTEVVRSEKHVHRATAQAPQRGFSPRAPYVYWYDESVTNPEFGTRSSRAKLGGRSENSNGRAARRKPAVVAPPLLALPVAAAPAWAIPPGKPAVSTRNLVYPVSPGSTTLTFQAGTVNVSTTELRNLHTWLKELFG